MKIISTKNIQTTLGLCVSYIVLLVLSACVSENELNPFGSCSDKAQPAKATGIDLVYEPYFTNRFASATDTVQADELKIFFRITRELITESSISSSFPGNAYALSCAVIYDFKNISKISVILEEPLDEFPKGTDISGLLINYDNQKLSDLKDFSDTIGQYMYMLDFKPSNYSQLKTLTTLELKNGEKITFTSVSPVLKNS